MNIPLVNFGNDGYLVSYLVDVDECELNVDECEQICIDTVGSYDCDCLSNYTLHSDGLRCIPGKAVEYEN